MTDLQYKLTDPSYIPLMFSLTPPKSGISPEKLSTMTERRLHRLSALNLDGIGIYDVQQEPGRSSASRPFEAHPFMDPLNYWRNLRKNYDGEAVLFCAAGRFSPGELRTRIKETAPLPIVFVGAPSGGVRVRTTLKEAYSMFIAGEPRQICGGICIPERNGKHRREAERMLEKANRGVSFFVTQCIYDLPLMTDTLKEYSRLCRITGISPRRIIFTLSPLDSEQSLEFFRWLGIRIPAAVETRILGRTDPLDESVMYLKEASEYLAAVCRELEIPWGYNIESVISRKNPFLAAVELASMLKSGDRLEVQPVYEREVLLSEAAGIKKQGNDLIFSNRLA